MIKDKTMRTLKSSLLLLLVGAALLGALTPAFADVDITTSISSPPSVSLSTTTQTTIYAYTVTLTPYPNETGETFNPVYFTAKTTVTAGVSGEPARFDFAGAGLPVGCNATSTLTDSTLNCLFSPSQNPPTNLYSNGPPKVFTVRVQTPTAGTQITLTSRTSWFEPVPSIHPSCGSNPAPSTFPLPTYYTDCYETEGLKTTVTTLTPADPTVVETFVPLAGGTVTTGSQGGAATCAGGATGNDPNKWVTIVKVPEPAQVGVNLNRVSGVDDDVPENTIFFSRILIPNLVNPGGDPQLFGEGTRWYDPDAKTKLVVNTLRRDKCTIGSGLGTLKDALLILKEKIYYKPDIAYPPRVPDATYRQLHLCFVTSGPYPGEPCILYARVYSKFVTSNSAYWGDHEWVILSNENGKIAPGK